jgi:hypothetical protein
MEGETAQSTAISKSVDRLAPPHAHPVSCRIAEATFLNASQPARASIRLAVFLKVRRRLPSPDPL